MSKAEDAGASVPAPAPTTPEPIERNRVRAGWLRRVAGSLRMQILASFFLLAVLPLGVVAVSTDWATRTWLTEAAYRSLGASASQTALSLDAFVTTNLTILGTEAQLPVFSSYLQLSAAERAAEPAQDVVRAMLTSLSQRDRVFIASYGLLDANGRSLVDTSPAHELDESARYHFKHAIEYDEPTASNVEFLPTDQQAYLYFSSPIHDASGAPVGVLRVQYNAAVLKQVVVAGSGQLGGGSFAMVLDDEHMVLASGMGEAAGESSLVYARLDEPPEDMRARLIAARRLLPGPPKLLAEPGILQGLAGVTRDAPYFGCRLLAHGGMETAAATTRMRAEPWTVLFFLPQSAFLAPVKTQTRSLLVLSLLVIALATATATLLARSLSRPLTRLTATASALARGDLDLQVKVTSRGEIGVLESAFHRMAGDIKRLVDSLAERNQDLNAANEVLQRQNLLLEEELIERARKEALLLEQQEAIRLLSTPIISVWDAVLALPVIGVLDASRASQMMERLLDEIVREQALVAILDLTGVDRVDEATMGYLCRIVRSASLLGSRCVLSGVSPAIALQMVALEGENRGILSFRTLQEALRYAIESTGKRRAPARRERRM